jgi:putative heme-binding domain-containing protein
VPALGRAVREGGSTRLRRNAVWALTRIDGAGARAAARPALDDKEPGVRQTAAYSAGLHRDAAALPRLLELLRTDLPPVRREAAAALGRLRQAAAVPALLAALRDDQGPFQEQALLHALIEVGARKATLPGLADPNARVRRGALIALDQMAGGDLTREQVVPLLDAADAGLRQTALEVVARRAGWAGAVTGLLGRRLHEKDVTPARRAGLEVTLRAFLKEPAVQDLVARCLGDKELPPASRLLLLDAMARAPLAKPPPAWLRELGRALQDPDERVALGAVAAARAAGAAGLDTDLLRLARERARGEGLRVAALQAVGPRAPAPDAALFDFLLACLRPEKPPLLRLGAATCLGEVPLSPDQLGRLAPETGRAGPLELPRVLPAFERGRGAALGKELVAALGRSPGLPGLTAAALRKTLAAYPPKVRELARPLLKRLEADGARQAARLAELAPLLKEGDAGRGRAQFFSPRALCSTCHAVGGQGGRVGPDLSHIAATRTGRELLEAVVFPSASFARGFEPYVVATTDGRTFTGILTRETADAVYLVGADRAEVPLPRALIDTIQPGRVSIMPQGLDAQLTRDELADVLAFLRSLK